MELFADAADGMGLLCAGAVLGIRVTGKPGEEGPVLLKVPSATRFRPHPRSIRCSFCDHHPQGKRMVEKSTTMTILFVVIDQIC